jgi:hypothetical protein
LHNFGHESGKRLLYLNFDSFYISTPGRVVKALD